MARFEDLLAKVEGPPELKKLLAYAVFSVGVYLHAAKSVDVASLEEAVQMARAMAPGLDEEAFQLSLFATMITAFRMLLENGRAEGREVAARMLESQVDFVSVRYGAGAAKVLRTAAVTIRTDPPGPSRRN